MTLSNFDTFVNSQISTLHGIFGVPATFTPTGGSEISLEVFYQQEQVDMVDGGELVSSGYNPTVEALISDIGSYKKGVFVIGGSSFTTVSILEEDEIQRKFVVRQTS